MVEYKSMSSEQVARFFIAIVSQKVYPL